MTTTIKPRTGLRVHHERFPPDRTVIGLALGSPREQVLPPTPEDDLGYFSHFSPSPETAMLKPAPLRPLRNKSPPKASKPKSQKWRGIGTFFGRKPTPVNHGQPIYSLERAVLHERPRFNPTPQSPEDLSMPSLRQRVDFAPQSHHQIKASVNPRQGLENRGLLRRASSRRKVVRHNVEELRVGRPRALTAPLQSSPLAPGPGPAPAPPPARTEKPRAPRRTAGAPAFLQVDIPNVEMERYSVMFQDLLKSSHFKALPRSQSGERELPKSPNTPPETPEKPPALSAGLVRLKATRKDSKDSTSSVGSKTPSFSLFPNTTSASKVGAINKPLPKPSPLSRSVTAPDVAAPLARPSIKSSQSEEPSGLMILLQERDQLADSAHRPTQRRHYRHGSSLGQSISSANSIPKQSFESSISLLPAAPIRESQNQEALSVTVTPPTTVTQQSAFPARSSSLKQRNTDGRTTAHPNPSRVRNNSTTIKDTIAHHLDQLDSALPLPPPIHTPRPDAVHASSSNTSSIISSVDASDTAELHVVSIARQVSVSRREKREVELVDSSSSTSTPSATTHLTPPKATSQPQPASQSSSDFIPLASLPGHHLHPASTAKSPLVFPPSPQPEKQTVLARQAVKVVDQVGNTCGGEEALRKSTWGVVEDA